MNPYLKRCLDLAKMAGNQTAGNPLVGAVIVHQGEIIGEGFHEFFGGPHAEVNAIRSVSNPGLLEKSDLYVSLEPCNHKGKTPPCTDLILYHKIPRVMIGCTDPNPEVSGTGASKLIEKGVKVLFAKDPAPFIQLNRKFFVNQKEGRPYITLKWAESQDGFIAGWDESNQPVSTKISCESSDHFVHRLRAENQAILVGKNTVMVDDPALTVRLFPGNDPVKIVVDINLEIPAGKKIFNSTGKLIVLNRIKSQTTENVIFHQLKNDFFREMRKAMEEIYSAMGISNILVEGGSKTLKAFFDAGLYDEVWKIESPLQLSKGLKGPLLPNAFQFDAENKTGTDFIRHYQRKNITV